MSKTAFEHYDRQSFSLTGPLLDIPGSPTAPMVEVLEPPLSGLGLH